MDERDLRAGLRSLTATPPPPPAERVESAVRRSVRIRRTRAATSVALVVALAAPVAYGVTRLSGSDTAQPTGRSIATWPERNDPALGDLRDAALRAYTDEHGGPRAGERVRFLYSERVAGTEYAAVAFAFCAKDDCSRAVLAAHPELDGTDGGYWVSVTREVRDGAPVAPLSMLVPSTDERPDGTTNVVLVVAGPDAREVTWQSPSRQPGTGGSGALAGSGGVFAGNIGFVSAPVTVTVRDGVSGEVGEQTTPTGVGQGRMLAAPDSPDGLDHQYGIGATIGAHDEPLVWGQDFPGGRYTLMVRCLGAGPLRLTAKHVDASVPCDGRPHRVDSTGAAPAGPLNLRTTGEIYTSFAFSLAVRP